MRSKYLVLEILLLAVVLAATVWAYPYMPARIATHWGIHGQVNGHGPRWVMFLIGPGEMLFFIALAHLGPWLSPKQFSVEGFYTTFRQVILLSMAIVTYVTCVILWVDTGNPVDVLRMTMGGIFLFSVLFGNLMGKIRRNFYVGVRTPWTIASERVWNATHRFAAKAWVAMGLVGLVLTVSGFRQMGHAAILLILVTVLASALYSLVYYKRLERAGEL